MLFINSKQTYHLSVEGNCDWNMTSQRTTKKAVLVEKHENVTFAKVNVNKNQNAMRYSVTALEGTSQKK